VASLLWQLKHARWASARVYGLSQAGSATSDGLVCQRQTGMNRIATTHTLVA